MAVLIGVNAAGLASTIMIPLRRAARPLRRLDVFASCGKRYHLFRSTAPRSTPWARVHRACDASLVRTRVRTAKATFGLAVDPHGQEGVWCVR